MIPRIAAVSFLNSWPLVDALAGRDDVQLVTDIPSQLPELLHEDRADAALVPVVEWFRGAGAGVVPGIALATGGPVDSVKLFARVPPPEIRHVAVDRGSKTSVALLRVLFAELWGVEPDFKVVVPQVGTLLDEADAALVIGDRCFAAEKRFRDEGLLGAGGIHEIDLGDTWRQMTGLPFVFAVWVMGDGFTARSTSAERDDLIRLLQDAKETGLGRIDALADRAVAEGRLGPGGSAEREAIVHYFRESMSYDLGAEELAGLRRFHSLCVEHRIIPAGRGLDPADLTGLEGSSR